MLVLYMWLWKIKTNEFSKLQFRTFFHNLTKIQLTLKLACYKIHSQWGRFDVRHFRHFVPIRFQCGWQCDVETKQKQVMSVRTKIHMGGRNNFSCDFITVWLDAVKSMSFLQYLLQTKPFKDKNIIQTFSRLTKALTKVLYGDDSWEFSTPEYLTWQSKSWDSERSVLISLQNTFTQSHTHFGGRDCARTICHARANTQAWLADGATPAIIKLMVFVNFLCV